MTKMYKFSSLQETRSVCTDLFQNLSSLTKDVHSFGFKASHISSVCCLATASPE